MGLNWSEETKLSCCFTGTVGTVTFYFEIRRFQ